MTAPTGQPGTEGLVLADPALVATLRRRRASLRSLMGRLEDAVAAPLRDDPALWRSPVGAATADLRTAFDDHLRGTEGPDGYYDGLLAQAPRLAHRVSRLRDEHRRIDGAFEVLQGALLRAADHPEAVDAVDEVRDAVVALLALLARHRQHGSDLLWEAYAFDVGGEG